MPMYTGSRNTSAAWPRNTGDDHDQLHEPTGVAVNPNGEFLIAERQVSAAGVITRVAGTGTPGNTGDDGPATDAQLHEPAGMALTSDGGFLIADVLNNEVRQVSAG